MDKRWVIKDEGDSATVKMISQELGIDKKLANLLVQRGITSFNEAKLFFRPELSQLHDPFLMKDMDIAVDRISKAIQDNEKILVYGDYDVDGTSAVALVYAFFKSIYKNDGNIDYYIPDRYNEGYGISYLGIDFAAANEFKLIIALDCGIKAEGQVKYAKEKVLISLFATIIVRGNVCPKQWLCLTPKDTIVSILMTSCRVVE